MLCAVDILELCSFLKGKGGAVDLWERGGEGTGKSKRMGDCSGIYIMREE